MKERYCVVQCSTTKGQGGSWLVEKKRVKYGIKKGVNIYWKLTFTFNIKFYGFRNHDINH